MLDLSFQKETHTVLISYFFLPTSQQLMPQNSYEHLFLLLMVLLVCHSLLSDLDATLSIKEDFSSFSSKNLLSLLEKVVFLLNCHLLSCVHALFLCFSCSSYCSSVPSVIPHYYCDVVSISSSKSAGAYEN